MTRRVTVEGPLKFLTPPEAQGQIIEVSYAGTYDSRVLKRVHDRSDRTTSYYVADLSAEEQESDGPCGLNVAPGIDGEWTACTVEEEP